MCGEKRVILSAWTRWLGSPPHVRGKVGAAGLNNLIDGITPACAGKRGPARRRWRDGWDHPRMCGEKSFVVHVLPPVLGSPPHVRGKDDGRRAEHPQGRITPACAGKSSSISGPVCGCGDHPRMCGEKPMVLPCLLLKSGSPPHVRGKGGGRYHVNINQRITPACAGKRHPASCLVCYAKDHPRMCGEKTKKIP